MRCIADVKTGKLWSRKRKQILGLPHIEKAVRDLGPVALKHGVEWLDGELYVHGLTF